MQLRFNVEVYTRMIASEREATHAKTLLLPITVDAEPRFASYHLLHIPGTFLDRLAIKRA